MREVDEIKSGAFITNHGELYQRTESQKLDIESPYLRKGLDLVRFEPIASDDSYAEIWQIDSLIEERNKINDLVRTVEWSTIKKMYDEGKLVELVEV